MKFNVNQQDIQKSLNFCQGIVEKRNTLPILSNVLLDVSNGNLTITATDLDIIFIHKISNVEIIEEGKTTTSSSIMYDIVRKFSSGKKINFSNIGENKLHLESEKSVFNLNCISPSEFPLTDENFNQNEFFIKSKQFLKLLNKCKFSVSNDETRHYLSGIFFHQTQVEDKVYLTAAATDSHRMSISKVRLDQKIDFEPIILPKKTIFQLCSLLEDFEGDVKISNVKSKIKFELNNSVLISKLIDGKFPNYIQVIPKNNQKKLEIDLDLFLHSVDRVASVSLDKKDGVTLVQKDMRLQEYEALGLGDEVMEVDLLGKKGQNLAGTIMRKGDKIPDDAEKKLVARAGKVRQYLYDFLQDATGGERMSLKQADDVFRKTAKEESTPVYNKAFYTKGKFRTVSDTDLNALFMMPEFKKAYKRAIYLAKHDTPPVKLAPMPKKGFPEGHQFPVYALDKVKKALSSKFGKDSIFHPDPNVKALAAQMTQHKNTMLDVIEKYNGDYKQARDTYAGYLELKDATEMGKKLFDSEDAFDKFYEHSTKLRTNAERAEFRNAAFNVLAKKIESSSVNPKGMSTFFMNEQNMKKLELLIPDPEKRARFLRQNELLSGFVDVKNKIVGGSPTAEKLAADAGEEEMSQSIRAVSNIANRNPAGLAQQATDLVAGTQRGARLDEAGKKMYQQKTPNIQAAHEDSLLTNQVLKNKMRKGLLDQGAGAAGGASLLNSLLQ